MSRLRFAFGKQLGAKPLVNGTLDGWPDPLPKYEITNHGVLLKPRHKKGGDPAEWPEDLRVRQIPRA